MNYVKSVLFQPFWTAHKSSWTSVSWLRWHAAFLLPLAVSLKKKKKRKLVVLISTFFLSCSCFQSGEKNNNVKQRVNRVCIRCSQRCSRTDKRSKRDSGTEPLAVRAAPVGWDVTDRRSRAVQMVASVFEFICTAVEITCNQVVGCCCVFITANVSQCSCDRGSCFGPWRQIRA